MICQNLVEELEEAYTLITVVEGGNGGKRKKAGSLLG